MATMNSKIVGIHESGIPAALFQSCQAVKIKRHGALGAEENGHLFFAQFAKFLCIILAVQTNLEGRIDLFGFLCPPENLARKAWNYRGGLWIRLNFWSADLQKNRGINPVFFFLCSRENSVEIGPDKIQTLDMDNS